MEDKNLSVQDQDDYKNHDDYKNQDTYQNQEKDEKKLMRSGNKMLLGVCSGIAEFFGIDATLIRLIAVFFSLAGIGSGIVVYIIAAIIMPKAPDYR
ncbi:MAG: PspC domain-containing protein [Spirochaetaceae bacterium]|jgi:phage shock protein C|nr:PspC domain-containing protein [Spirochaetaceae bacterium]